MINPYNMRWSLCCHHWLHSSSAPQVQRKLTSSISTISPCVECTRTSIPPRNNTPPFIHCTMDGSPTYGHSWAIQIIWEYKFDCWKQCNTHLHSPINEPPTSPYLPNKSGNLLISHRDLSLAFAAPTQTAKQILQCPLPLICSWAQHGAQHVQNYLTAAHKHAILHTQGIWNFKSSPNKTLTWNHHNQPQLYHHVGLLVYYLVL